MGELITEIFAHGAKELLRGTTELVEVELELGLLCLKGGVGEQDGRSEEPNRVRERLLLGGLGGLVLGGKGGVRLHLTDLQSDTIEDLRMRIKLSIKRRPIVLILTMKNFPSAQNQSSLKFVKSNHHAI